MDSSNLHQAPGPMLCRWPFLMRTGTSAGSISASYFSGKGIFPGQQPEITQDVQRMVKEAAQRQGLKLPEELKSLRSGQVAH